MTVNTVDSNATGTVYCEEVYGSPGTISTPTWYPIQPNSYVKFGGANKTVARSPITESRQRSKGVTVDVDAAVGYETDFTQSNLYDLLQGFFFADWRTKFNATPSAVSGTVYTVASATGVVANSLVFGAGFGVTGNNGFKIVTARTSTTITCSGLAIETPPATAKLTAVGFYGGSGDITLTVSAGVGTIASTVLDFTTLGLIAGEWLFVGGDASGLKFATAASNGWYRIQSVAAHAIVCDVIPASAATDTGSGKTIQIFFGHVIKNEATAALIKKRSYRFERFLTTSNYETVDKCYCNTLSLSVKTGDKITAALDFIGGTNTPSTTAEATGTRATLVNEGAFNATSHVKFLRLYDTTSSATLFSYVTDFTLNINNNMTPVKAVSVLGNLDTAAGDFTGSAAVTAYYTSNTAVTAITANHDVGVAGGIVKDNAGWLFDLPLNTVSGEIKVEKDKPITIPLTIDGAAHATLNHTLLMQSFTYLPDLAE